MNIYNTLYNGQYDINNIKAGNHATPLSTIVIMVIFIIDPISKTSLGEIQFKYTNFKQLNQI